MLGCSSEIFPGDLEDEGVEGPAGNVIISRVDNADLGWPIPVKAILINAYDGTRFEYERGGHFSLTLADEIIMTAAQDGIGVDYKNAGNIQASGGRGHSEYPYDLGTLVHGSKRLPMNLYSRPDSVEIEVLGDNEKLDAKFSRDSSEILSLGNYPWLAEKDEVTYTDSTKKAVPLGTRYADFRMRNGVFVKSPAVSGGNDQVVLYIPSD
jgi:hypothetical protein